jgi:hypothetical protein
VSHKGIRLLIQDVAQKLGDDIQFTYARTSDFNLTASNERYPAIVLDPLSSIPEYVDNNVSNYMKRWVCSMAFYDKDQSDSVPAQYQEILDKMDDYVDKFVTILNFYSLNSDTIVVTSMNQQPFIKATAGILTGYILTFQIQQTDQFNYCGLDC